MMPGAPPPGEGRRTDGGLATLGVAAVAVVCCAGLPLLAALASGLAVATLLGLAAGVLAALASVAALVIRVRR